MKKIISRLSILVTLLLTSSCASPSANQQPTIPDPDYWPASSWQISIPEQQGMDSGRLTDLFEEAGAKDINLHSLLIVRNRYVVTEAYYNPYWGAARIERDNE